MVIPHPRVGCVTDGLGPDAVTLRGPIGCEYLALSTMEFVFGGSNDSECILVNRNQQQYT